MDISLFRMIPQEVRDSVFVNSVPLMNVISHEIEDVVMNNNLKVDFYAGFQHFSRFTRQLKRYTRLANVCRRVYVWGIPDVDPPAIPGVEYLPLSPDMALAREWFLVVDSPTFFTALLTQEQTYGQDVPPGQRAFEGIWTYDSDIVSRAHLLMSQLLGNFYQGVSRRDYEWQSKHLVQISNRLVQRQDTHDTRAVLSQHHSSLLKAGLSHIELPLLILDHHQQVITATHAAAALLHTPIEALQGHPVRECAGGLFASLELPPGDTPPTRLKPAEGTPLEVTTSAILDAGNTPMGWLVSLQAEGMGPVGRMSRGAGSAVLPVAPTLQRYLGGMQQLVTMLPTLTERPDVQQRVITQMQRLVSEANTLVQRLALLQEIGAGSVEMRRLALPDLVRQVVSDWQPQATGYTVRVTIDPASESLQLAGNEELLQVALRELLTNVQEHAHGSTVVVRVQQQNGLALLAVQDDGEGIDQGDLAQLAEPFQTTGDGNGSSARVGLGLALARAVATAHKGRLDISSTPGQGSTFTLLLPTG